jgi:ubiquinone/menaquinone biosynthesis C-methylase UbiE
MSKADENDPYLRSFQEAFRPELQAAIRWYSLPDRARVLDCPCGNGFYTELLAEHMGSGRLVAADLTRGCLDHARERLRRSRHDMLELSFVEAEVYRLPFEDNTFDFVWCAQSFISISDPVRALKELGRVVRGGGRVAVLETDEYHHVLLPWPIPLELALQRAIRKECRKRYGTGGKFSQSRRLRNEFLEAGLSPEGKRTIVADRSAPLGPAEREFLLRHLDYLKQFLRMELTPREMLELERASDPEDENSLLNRTDGELTCLASITCAVKPVR